MRLSGLAVVATIAALGFCGAAAAQVEPLSGRARDARLSELERMATLGRPAALPANAATLDEALAAADYPRLRAAMAAGTMDEASRSLNWSKIAVFKGAPFAASFFYVTDLWTTAENMERAARDPASVAQQVRSLKTTSLMMAIHTLSLVEVDGQRCADPRASARHLADMERALAAQWAYGRALPEDGRARLLSEATRLEALNAPVRQPDTWLCVSDAVLAGSPTAVDDPATPGSDVELAVPMETLFVGDAVWSSRVAAGRAAALQVSRRLLGLENVAPAAAP